MSESNTTEAVQLEYLTAEVERLRAELKRTEQRSDNALAALDHALVRLDSLGPIFGSTYEARLAAAEARKWLLGQNDAHL